MRIFHSFKCHILNAAFVLPVLFSNIAWAHDARIAAAKDCQEHLLDHLKSKSFSNISKEISHPTIEAIDRIYSERRPEQQLEIDEQLTKQHFAQDMSFQVKNPKTNIYDKFVAVPADSRVAPILEGDFQRLVQSTGPVLRAIRSLLQKVYSTKGPVTVQSLGLGHLPPLEAELLINVINESIYLEPRLRDPVMAEYPFITVAGFDGAIVDPAHPKPVFYEMNLGTPSGLSNNKLLLDELLRLDWELDAALQYALPSDNTFIQFRQALESNGRAWTKREGLTVALGPGIYNGAHPDVAAIAQLSGIPIVQRKDLYVDSNGYWHLDVTHDEHFDPIVTTIYGRAEESFGLQSNEDGIPAISPNYLNSPKLQARLGVPLKKGVIYDYRDKDGQPLFVYDEDRIADVAKDWFGRPLFSEQFDKPQNGSLAKSILERKLYYSAVGGRVADDKRLFQIICDHFIKDEDKHNLAVPIKSLKISEYEKFYADPQSFVVKEPANSGGSGVDFPLIMNDEDTLKLIASVKTNPRDYKIEYLGEIATLTKIQKNKDQSVGTVEAPIDLRIYTMMDADGKVHAGPNSLLLRVASGRDLHSNTSKGGGYGVGVVIKDDVSTWQPPTRRRPKARDLQLQPPSKDQAAARIFTSIRELKDLTSYVSKGNWEAQQEYRLEAKNLSYSLRELMDYWDNDIRSLIGDLRKLEDSDQKIDLRLIDRKLSKVLTKLTAPGSKIRLGGELHDLLFEKKFNRLIDEDDILKRAELELPTSGRLKAMATPEVNRVVEDSDVKLVELMELAEYESVDDPAVQSVIDAFRAAGGEVRYLQKRIRYKTDKNYHWWKEPPYFAVNTWNPALSSYLKPVIAIDLSKPDAYPALMHEYAHFQFWKERYDQLRAQGMNHQEACFHLNLQMSDGEFRLLSERNSIRAEMQAESEHKNSPYNRAHYRAHDFWESGYINRLAYPEFEAVRSELEESKNREPNKQKARLYMKQMVEFALKARDEALAYRKKHQMGLKFAMGDTIYDLIAKPYGMERLGWPDEMKENPTLTSKILFLEVLRDVCDELNVPAHQCDQENMPRPQTLKAVRTADFSTLSHPVDDGQQQ